MILAEVTQFLRWFRRYHRKLGRIKQTNLSQQTPLIPINMFVGNLTSLKFHDHDMGQLYLATSRGDARQHKFKRHIMSERKDKLVHHPFLAHGARNSTHLGVGRHLSHKIFLVEILHSGTTKSTRHGCHIENIGMSGHRFHGGLDIMVNKFMSHVLIENCSEIRRGRSRGIVDVVA